MALIPAERVLQIPRLSGTERLAEVVSDLVQGQNYRSQRGFMFVGEDEASGRAMYDEVRKWIQRYGMNVEVVDMSVDLPYTVSGGLSAYVAKKREIEEACKNPRMVLCLENPGQAPLEMASMDLTVLPQRVDSPIITHIGYDTLKEMSPLLREMSFQRDYVIVRELRMY
jgi:hypothetical protein